MADRTWFPPSGKCGLTRHGTARFPVRRYMFSTGPEYVESIAYNNHLNAFFYVNSKLA